VLVDSTILIAYSRHKEIVSYAPKGIDLQINFVKRSNVQLDSFRVLEYVEMSVLFAILSIKFSVIV